MVFAESPGTNTVLIMTSSLRTCSLVNEFLSSLDANAPRGTRGRRMMLDKLHLYVWWKSKLSEKKKEGQGTFYMPDGRVRNDSNEGGSEVSEALRKKDRERQERSANRRRVRGGAPAPSTSRDIAESKISGLQGEASMREEADDIAALLVFIEKLLTMRS